MSAFSLLLLVCFSCGSNDNEQVSPSIAEQLKGKWTKSLIRLQYYDATGKMDFEDRITEENGEIYEFDGSTLILTDNDDNSVQKATYTIRQRDGKNYVHLTDGTDDVENEIVSISDTKLVWQDDYKNLEYHDGTGRIAAKAIYVEEFTR